MEKIGLRNKILLLMALPIFGLLIFSGLFISDKSQTVQDAVSFLQLIELVTNTTQLVHEIQKERGETSGFLGSNGTRFEKKLIQQRLKTDHQIAKMDNFLLKIDKISSNEGAIRKLESARERFQDLNRIRTQVNSLKLDLESALSYYTKINKLFLEGIKIAAHASYRVKGRKDLLVLSIFAENKEAAGIERAILSNVFSHNSFNGKEALHRKLLDLITVQEIFIVTFLTLANNRQKAFFQKQMADPSVKNADAMGKVAEQGLDQATLGIDPLEWWDAQTKKINILKKVEGFLVGEVIEIMEENSKEARNEIIVLSLAVIVVLGASLVLGFILILVINKVVRVLKDDKEKIAEAETEIRRAEAFKSTMLSSTSEAIVTIDDQGLVVEMNSAMEEIFGYSKKEAVGNQIEELIIPPDSREKYIAGMQQFFKTGKSPSLGKRFEVTALRKDGREIIVEMIVNPMRFDDRFYFTSFLRDITHTIEAKKELSTFKTTLDQTQDCIFIFDPASWKFTYVNRSAVKQVGYSAKELACMTPLDIKPFFNKEQFKEKVRPLIDGNSESILYETLHRTKAGVDIPVEINLQYIKPSGEDPRFVAIVRDISERKKAHSELKRLVGAIEQVVESVVMTDVEGNIVYVNNGFETVTGYTREEVVGQNSRILSSGKQTKKFYQEMWKTLLAGEVWQGEFINKRKDGTLFEEEGTISSVYDSDDQKIGYIAVRRDVTEERRLEKQMQQSLKMEALGVFTGGIAHDFNNILTPIICFTELLKIHLPGEDPRINEYLEAIQRASTRAKDLISQILLFSRQKDASRFPLKLDSIVKEVIKLLRSAIPATIEIRSKLDPNGSFAHVDITQIHSLLMNLATNASHAMPNGGHLNINLKDAVFNNFEVSNGNRLTGKFVHLSVADNGTGMDESTLSRIFEPFFTTKEVGSGTGLGLSTVFGIVQQHNGHISVQSEVGKGTTFDIYLPALEDQTEEKQKGQKEMDFRGNESIFFVDDEAAIVRSSSIALEMLGYQVTAFTSSKEALKSLKEDPSKVDLMVTDQTMPYLTGTRLADSVHRVRRDLPIVISSGNHIDLPEEKMGEIGVKSILAKPYPIDELVRVIRNVLDEAKT